MKEITITIKHNLTPMHEESMAGMLQATLTALTIFWNNKSKKMFTVTTEEHTI